MAGPNVNYGTENPFEPDTTISLSGITTHYAGFGYENVAESVVSLKIVPGLQLELKQMEVVPVFQHWVDLI